MNRSNASSIVRRWLPNILGSFVALSAGSLAWGQAIHSAVMAAKPAASTIELPSPPAIAAEQQTLEPAVPASPYVFRAGKSALSKNLPLHTPSPSANIAEIDTEQAMSSSETEPPATTSTVERIFRLASSRRSVTKDAIEPEANVTALQTIEPTTQPPAADDSQIVLNVPQFTASAREIACRAAQCWGPSRLLLQRANTVLESRNIGDCRAAAEMKAEFLRQQAAWQQDIVAANALRAAYSLLAADLQSQQIDEGLRLIDEQQKIQTSLQAKGIAVPDPTALERKKLDLLDKQLVLAKNRHQLHTTLTQLLRLSGCQQIVVAESLDVQATSLDCNCLLQAALRQRHDLLAWQSVSGRLDGSTAQAASELLATVAGNVAAKVTRWGIVGEVLAKLHTGELRERIACELRTILETQQRLIQASVCERCNALSIACERMGLAEQMKANWDARVAALERLGTLGDAKPEALGEARAELIQANSTLIERRLSARLAEIDLAEACGGLAARCCCGEPWFVCQ